VTARITPFNPGASPPPVSIPTLRTSAIRLLLLQACERDQSSKTLTGLVVTRCLRVKNMCVL
jgi:hypothetical protein